MADRPEHPDDRRYGWLYGSDTDDEATRRNPASGRAPMASSGSGSGGDPDPTRVMPAGGTRDPYSRPDGRAYRSTGPPPPMGSRASGGGRPRRPRRWGRTVLLILLVWLVFLIAVPIWAWTKIDKVNAEPRNRPDSTPGATYLLVGSDSRQGLSRKERKKLATGNVAGQRTDTILLLHEPLFGGETLLLSLPRDSIVDIPGHGTNKLNAAFSFGGPKLLVRTIESETGLRVDNYVEIGLGGFVNVVDAVGGVRICPKTAMEDPKAGLDIKKGCQQADGADALGYVRTREDATGDIARGQRQRAVVGQVASKAASPWSVINPFRYVALNSSGAEALRIGENVGPIDLARFAWAMRKVSGKDAKTCTVPIVDLAVNWDDQRASRMFEKIAEDNTDEIGRRLCTKTGLPR
ncbi:MAG: LCP family protein [Nocardioidaceae bacterium]